MKLTSIAFLMLLTTTIAAQSAEATPSSTPDQRLYEVYDQSYIETLLKENPFLIARWNYYLDHAYNIIDAIPGKTDDAPEVSISNMDNINILLLEKEQGLTHDYHLPVYYNIKNTKKCLVYLPGKKFAKDLRELLAEK